MTIKIGNTELPEAERKYIKKIYEEKYADYLKRRDAILKEGADMEPLLIALEIIPPKNQGTASNQHQDITEEYKVLFSTFEFVRQAFGGDNYNAAWSWLQKCKHIINHANKPLTSNEIIDVLIKFYEPDATKERLNNSIPATLSVAVKDNKLTRQKRENGEYEYSVIYDRQ